MHIRTGSVSMQSKDWHGMACMALMISDENQRVSEDRKPNACHSIRTRA